MRYSIILFAAVFVFFLSQRMQAQQVIMSSSLTRDVTTGEMVGYSRTEMDFNTQAWYQAYVYHEIRRQTDNALLASGEAYSVPGSNSVAARTSRTPGVANVTYRLDSKHWIYPLSNYFCTTTRLDRYQFTTIGPPYIGGNYGATQTFFGYDPGYITGACVLGWIYLGQTTELKTVPSVTITNPGIGSIPSQSTQTALLGADVVLSSTVTPTGGTYSWTFTGPYSISGGSTSGSSVTVRSSDVGAITVRLTYTQNGIPESQQFTINVVIPTLQSFTAQQGSDFVTAPGGCNSPDSFWWYRLGCIPPQNIGISFTATVQAPTFISDPTQSGIKYVQATSAWRRWNDVGQKCITIRSSESNVDSGWQRDSGDPYDPGGFPPIFFTQGNTLSMPTVDYPKTNLTFIQAKEFVDTLYVDDQFWMYVFYFAGTASNPSVQRPIGRLRWNWGGLVVFDRVDQVDVHHLRYTNALPTTRTGEATSSTVNMQGQLSTTAVPCPGGPNPLTNNRIDSSRVLVQSYYSDILGRQASEDPQGWDAWTRVLAQCMFDLNCLQTMRVNTALWIFWSPEGIQKMGLVDPVMNNPPGSPNFNAATYNPRFVYWCYQKFLHRDPDQPSYDNIVALLNSTGDYALIVYNFVYSQEYRNRFV